MGWHNAQVYTGSALNSLTLLTLIDNRISPGHNSGGPIIADALLYAVAGTTYQIQVVVIPEESGW